MPPDSPTAPEVQQPVLVQVPSWVKKLLGRNDANVLSHELPVVDWQEVYAVAAMSAELHPFVPQSSSAGAEVSHVVPTQTPSAVPSPSLSHIAPL